MEEKWDDSQSDPIADIKWGIKAIRNDTGYLKLNPVVLECKCGRIDEVVNMLRPCPKCGNEEFKFVLREYT